MSKTPEERKEALARQVQAEVAKGWRVESTGDYQVEMVKGKPVNHLLHLILTLVTVFMWVVIWVLLAMFGGESRLLLIVDEFANVSRQHV